MSTNPREFIISIKYNSNYSITNRNNNQWSHKNIQQTYKRDGDHRQDTSLGTNQYNINDSLHYYWETFFLYITKAIIDPSPKKTIFFFFYLAVLKHVHHHRLVHEHHIPRSQRLIMEQTTIAANTVVITAVAAATAVVIGIHEVEDLIEWLQPCAELHHLSPKHRVLRLHTQVVLSGDVQSSENLAVLLPQLAHLSHEIIQMLLLAQPRAPSRLPVWQHSLALPLVHGCLDITFRARVLELAWTRWCSTWGNHYKNQSFMANYYNRYIYLIADYIRR